MFYVACAASSPNSTLGSLSLCAIQRRACPPLSSSRRSGKAAVSAAVAVGAASRRQRHHTIDQALQDTRAVTHPGYKQKSSGPTSKAQLTREPAVTGDTLAGLHSSQRLASGKGVLQESEFGRRISNKLGPSFHFIDRRSILRV